MMKFEDRLEWQRAQEEARAATLKEIQRLQQAEKERQLQEIRNETGPDCE